MNVSKLPTLHLIIEPVEAEVSFKAELLNSEKIYRAMYDGRGTVKVLQHI